MKQALQRCRTEKIEVCNDEWVVNRASVNLDLTNDKFTDFLAPSEQQRESEEQQTMFHVFKYRSIH